MKKVCFIAKTDDGEITYKFGVFNTKVGSKVSMRQLQIIKINNLL